MSKGLVIALAAIGGLFYVLYQSDPAVSRGVKGSGKGIVEITPSNFEHEVMGSSRPVLAYFWASW